MEQSEASPRAHDHGRAGGSLLSAEELAELGRTLGVHRVQAGTRLLLQGEPVEHVGVIVTGEVELLHRRGQRRMAVQVLHGGDLYGDFPMLSRVPMPFSAEALTDVAVIEIPHTVFQQLVEQRPELCRRLLISMAHASSDSNGACLP